MGISTHRNRLNSLARNQALRWVFVMVVIALTISFLDPQELVDVVRNARWSIVFPVVIGLAAAHSINAIAWHSMTAVMLRLNLSVWRTLKIYYASLVFGLLTPSNIGSDVFRARAQSSEQTTWRSTAIPIAVQRTTSFLSLGLLGIVGSLLLPVPAVFKLGAIGLVILLTFFIGAYFWLTHSSSERFASIHTLVVPRSTSADGIRGTRLSTAISFGVISGVAFHSVAILLTLGLVASTDLDISPLSALAAITVMRMSILVPFSVSGLGVQEGAAALIFPAAGMPAETGVAVSLLSRAGLLITIMIGAASLARIGSSATVEPSQELNSYPDQRAA